MRAVIQRVSEASCKVNEVITGQIGTGFLVLLGIEDADTPADLQWLAQKITGLRVFGDENGLMNKALATKNTPGVQSGGAPPVTRQLPGGRNFIQRNGKWFEVTQ